MIGAALGAALLFGAAQAADGGAPEVVSPRALEESAARAVDPAPLLIEAARARRALAEDASFRASAQRGSAAAPALEATTRESQACADDARRAWSRLAPQAAQLALQGKPMSDAVALVPAAGAEALYLDAVCASLWARSRGVTPLLERHGELRAELERAAQLDPRLDDGGPARELGRLLSALPPYAGGDLDAARRHFEESLALSPGAARTRVAYAEGVAIKLQDRALFKKLLEPVAAERTSLGDKARALLQREEELFGR